MVVASVEGDAVATAAENLESAITNICAQIKDLTDDPKPTYSVAGRSISWGEHFNNLCNQLKTLQQARQMLGQPFWKVSRGKA